jgi:hypothetical protein
MSTPLPQGAATAGAPGASGLVTAKPKKTIELDVDKIILALLEVSSTAAFKKPRQ